MLNKKGVGFDDIVPALITLIFIVIIILIFASYQVHKEKAKYDSIYLMKTDIGAHELLLNYLQRNTTFDINNNGVKEKVTFADLIIFSFLQDKKDIYNYIEKETEKILLEYKRSDKSGWNMRAHLRWHGKLDYREKIKVDTYTRSGTYSPLSQAFVMLPLGIDDKYIMVSLEEEAEVIPW